VKTRLSLSSFAAVLALLALPISLPITVHAQYGNVEIDGEFYELPPPDADSADAPINGNVEEPPPPEDEPIEPVPDPDPERIGDPAGAAYAGDQIVVTFRTTATGEAIQDIFNTHRLRVLAHRRRARRYVLFVPRGTDVRTLAQTLNRHPLVRYAELNYILRPGAIPTDPLYANPTLQWAPRRIGMEAAWDRTRGGSYRIAILDTGVKRDHVDLNPKIARDASGRLLGFNAVTGSETAIDDDTGHGTFVAGIAAAQTAFPDDGGAPIGMAGISPYSTFVPIKINYNTAGQAYSETVAVAINRALTYPGVRVINISFQFTPNMVTPSMFEALRRASASGVLVVSIMGNVGQGYTGYVYPGAFWTVMAVGSTTINDYHDSDSNAHFQISVAAPGRDVWSTTWWTNDSHGVTFGTSLAAPHVAGLATLLLQAYPSMTWYDLRYRIEDTAIDLNQNGWDPLIGWGRINADAATLPKAPWVYNAAAHPASRMVSQPFWALGLDPNNKSSDIPRLLPGVGSAVLWWDPARQEYQQYSSHMVPRIGPGRAYWVRVDQNMSVPGGGAYPFENPNHPAVVHLLPGWNQIGTPAPNPIQWNRGSIRVRAEGADGVAQEVSLAQAKAAGWVEDYAWYWRYWENRNVLVSETAPDALREIIPSEGYWIRAYRECQLLFPRN
jgi:subtilisin family serine protease